MAYPCGVKKNKKKNECAYVSVCVKKTVKRNRERGQTIMAGGNPKIRLNFELSLAS